MATTETELLARVEVLLRSRYITALAQPRAVKASHKDLVKYGTYLIAIANKLNGTSDRTSYIPTQLEILDIVYNLFDDQSQPQIHLGLGIILLFLEINYFVEEHFDNLASRDLATLSISQIQNTNLLAYSQIPVSPALARRKLLDLLFNKALDEISKKANFAQLRCNKQKLIKKIQQKMNSLLHACARENHREFDPRFIGAIASVNFFIRATAVTFVYYEQNNPQVPLELIFYIFAICFWGDALSKMISSIPTSKKHSANSMFTSAGVGALIFATFVILQEGHLGRRIAIEFGFYFGLPLLHFLIMHIPPFYKTIERLYCKDSYYYPREYDGSDIKRNLSGSGRLLGVFHLPAYVFMVGGIIRYCGYDIYDNFWPFFCLQLGIAILTQIAYFSYYYLSVARYAKSAEKDMLLSKIRFTPSISLERNQSLKALQAEIIWMIIFSNYFLRGFINLELAVESKLAKMIVAIASWVVVVFIGPSIGTIIKKQLLERRAPASVEKKYLEYLYVHRYILGLAPISQQYIERLLQNGASHPQDLAERIQQVSVGAQTGKMDIGFGDFNVLLSLLMMQTLSVFNYYIVDILLFNLLKDTNCRRGTLQYFYIEIFVNLAVIFAVIMGLILLLKPAKMPLVMVEMYSLPTRVGRALLMLTETTNLKLVWESFKKATFIKDYPAYHKDLSKRMENVIKSNYGPVLTAQPIADVQAAEPMPFVEITPTISPL